MATLQASFALRSVSLVDIAVPRRPLVASTSLRTAQCIKFPTFSPIHQVQPRRHHRHATVVASSAGSSPTENKPNTILTLPTLLTLGRVVAVPALIGAWFSQQWTMCTVIFLGAAITDFLDGYLARKMNLSSAFGAFLDPVADKLMVATVLILLGTLPIPAGPFAGNDWILPLLSCVIIGREITMSALREWAAAMGPEAHSAVAVSWMGKWKTATQMAAMTMLLAGRMPELSVTVAEAVWQGGVPLLGVAAVLTAWSLAEYFAGLWKFMK